MDRSLMPSTTILKRLNAYIQQIKIFNRKLNYFHRKVAEAIKQTKILKIKQAALTKR